MPTTEPLGSFRVFRDHRFGLDSALALFMTAQALATDAVTIVDVGCGRGALVDPAGEGRRMHDLRGLGRTVIGIDLDPAAAANPVIDEFRPMVGSDWPFEDGCVDLALCDWVLEHVDDPGAFVAELHRVLRPGGAFVARTVNRHSLLSLGARAVPNRSHSRVLTKLQPGRFERDVFPTQYRVNTVPDITAVFEPGFEWAVSFHPGLEHYASRWPRASAAIASVEARLPKRGQTVLLLAARRRP